MDLYPCWRCDGLISRDDKACPNCGEPHPFRDTRGKGRGQAQALMVVLAIALCVLVAAFRFGLLPIGKHLAH